MRINRWVRGIDITAPKLSIHVEPNQNGKATYLPLVAAKSGQTRQGKIVLRLDITNNEAKAITITGITFAFPGSTVAAVKMKGVASFFSGYYSTSGGATLSPGQTKTFTNGLVDTTPGDASTQVNNAIFQNEPIPGTIQAQITCAGFSEPATVTLPLVPHTSPTASGSYRFPYSASDLRVGEYYVGSAVHWANGGQSGGQIFAHDLEAEGVDPATNAWSRLLPGKNGAKNEDYRIYGKPIRAMADGKIIEVHDGMNANTPGAFPTPTPSPGTGNHVIVQHGDERITYCHMQKGSIPAALKAPGATVKAGDVLGLVGNTGNASEPHTHIEVEGAASTLPLRPFPFHDAYALEETAFHPPNPQGAWSKLTGRGLPHDKVAVWPAPTPPAWYPPGWGEVAQFGVPLASYQSVFDHAHSSGYRPVFVDGYEIGGHTFINVIFRPPTGDAWAARHGMTAFEYQEEFNARTKEGYRLTNLASYVSDGNVRYAAIFDKIGGPAWQAYHGLNMHDHQARFDQLTKEGYRPVNVSVTAAGGTALYAAFYEKRDVGSFVHLAGLTAAEYQQAWNDNTAAGRHAAYLGAYNTSGGPRFSAIFEQSSAGSGGVAGKHGLTGAQLQSEYDSHLGAGYLTRAIVGYEDGGSARFAALWRKP